jgi:hypothetical protein
MTVSTISLSLLGGLVILSYALWRFADHTLATIGRWIVWAVTLGHIRLSADSSESTAMGIAALTLITVFVTFVILAAYVH